MWWHTGFSSFLRDYLGEQYNNETGAGLQMGIGRCGTQGLLEREELCQVSGLRWCLGNHEIVLLQNCFLWSLLSREIPSFLLPLVSQWNSKYCLTKWEVIWLRNRNLIFSWLFLLFLYNFTRETGNTKCFFIRFPKILNGVYQNLINMWNLR